ncbi:hypothetical protein EDB19DRAFT_454134 [Suillus lakei]|nr:hypothetical protein EDB19DRAFT_454134 [Suillus lakei]
MSIQVLIRLPLSCCLALSDEEDERNQSLIKVNNFTHGPPDSSQRHLRPANTEMLCKRRAVDTRSALMQSDRDGVWYHKGEITSSRGELANVAQSTPGL